MSFIDTFINKYKMSILLVLLGWAVVATTMVVTTSEYQEVPVGHVVVEQTQLDKLAVRMDALEQANVELKGNVKDYEIRLIKQADIIETQLKEIEYLRNELKSRDSLIEQIISQRDQLEKNVEELERKLNFAVFGN